MRRLFLLGLMLGLGLSLLAQSQAPVPRSGNDPSASTPGGGGGLPDLPREARGRGVVSTGADGPDLGWRGMGEIYGVDRPVGNRTRGRMEPGVPMGL